jgi:Phosphate-selective porin O and P
VPAYIQGQYETHQDAQDQLSANGSILNKDRFSIRRARVGLTGEWQFAAIALQLDANTTNGPQVDLRKAEASLQYRPDRTRPPLIMATLGLFDIPFGFDNVEAEHTRFFMEPTTATQAFFPGKADVGARLAGALGFFRWTLAIMNGEPLGAASPYVEQDPNSAKDVIARFGFDTQPRSNLQIAGGMSGLTGEGFHPGSLASGSSLQWHDINGDGAVQPGDELVGVPAQAGAPSQNFTRWAIGADLRTSIRWWPGIAKVSAEITLAQNLDRSLYVADPVLTGLNQQELGFYVAAQQEITRWGIVGLRFDYYNPNSNLFDKRGGSLIPYSEAIQTVSPMIGLVLPDRARFVVQYDIIHNAYARSAVGVPASLADNVLTLRLQVQL